MPVIPVNVRGGLTGLALVLLAGCATIPYAPFPVNSISSERVQIVSAYAHAVKHGVSVEGFARQRGFARGPSGSHLHVFAELGDGRLAEADAAWRPPARHRTLVASYQALLRDVAMADVKRIDVEYRSMRDR